jgi:hypothetical protein
MTQLTTQSLEQRWRALGIPEHVMARHVEHLRSSAAKQKRRATEKKLAEQAKAVKRKRLSRLD